MDDLDAAYDEGYHFGLEDGFDKGERSFYTNVVSNAYKFGVDTADSNQLWNFLEKLGLDPYYKY